jgi:DNA polymerase III delta subunit
MKYVDFKKFTDENGACSIYLFEGEETYFRLGGEKLLLSRFVKEPTLDYVALDGSGLKGEKLKSLADAINCFPFLSEKRFVKVTEFYPTEKEFEFYLKPIFENPPKDSVLFISNAGKGKAGCAPLAKKPNVTFVDCARADEETIKKWIFITCKRAGVAADGITCGKIAAYCINDMSRVANETEKLLIYCAAKGITRLTDEIVDETVYADSEYKIYELANAVSRKNYGGYVRILDELSAKGFDEIALLNSLCAYFKGLYEVSLSRGSDRDVAAALGMKEYAVKKNREQAAKFKKGMILDYYENVYGAISGIKCGDLTPNAALKTVTARIFFGNSDKQTEK